MTENVPLPKISDKAVIIGHSGSGKTKLMEYIVRNVPFQLSRYRRIYVVDTANQLSEVPSYNFKGKTKCKHPRKYQECMKLHSPYELEAIVEKLNHKNKLEFFLVIDEVDRFMTPNSIEYETRLYLEEGRNFNRGGLFTVRRAGLLNKSIFSNAHYLYLFKVNNKADRDYLNTILDTDISKLVYNDEHSFYVFDLYQTINLGQYKLKLKK